jgi:hypothetical protein
MYLAKVGRMPATAGVDAMTSASYPERARFLGVRPGPTEPPIHAIDEDALKTMCGIALDAKSGVVLSFAPFMSTQAVAEMLKARVPPCETCRKAVEAVQGPPGEL